MVVVQLIGGVGNQMFQYACGRHLAILNKTELKLDLSFLQNRTMFRDEFVFRDYDLDMFNIVATIAAPGDIPLYPAKWRINSIPHRLYNLFLIWKKGFKYVLEWSINSRQRIRYRPSILNKRGNIYLAGYWASPKYFEKISSTIKSDFTFKESLPAHCVKLQEKINSCNSICINVRRKEFLTVKAMGFHGMDYILKAVELISQKVEAPHFFIFSDDLQWCRENIQLNFQTEFVGEKYYGPKYADYLQLMISCKHFIIPNSSYAWWAAWLSKNPDKIVITPKNYFQAFDTTDLIPEDWIRI